MRYILLALGILLLGSAPAQAAWRQASSPHFVIYSEDSAKSLQEFATKLERYDQAMRFIRGIPDYEVSPSNRVTIFVLPNMDAVRKLVGARRSSGVAGFYIGRASGSYGFTPRSTGPADVGDMNELIVLLHEYAHHFMFQSYPGAFPAWLVEGFAEFNSTAQLDRDGSVGLGLPANHRAYGLLLARPIKIEKLLTGSVGDFKTLEERDVLYGRGWLLTHYLTFEPTRQGQLSTYVAEINKGTKSLDAAKKAFGDLAKLDKDLDKYVRQPKLYYHRLPADKISIGKVEVADVSPGAAAVMELRMRLKRGTDETEAKTLVPLLRKAAAPFPNDPMAQTTLAEAEFDAGNYKEADAAADRALAADPRHVEALLYKGKARMELAGASDSADAAVWKDVRKWYLAANKIEPNDPEPLMLYYQSFLAEGVRPTPNAAAGLRQALELAPQDYSLRWMVAFQDLRDGKADEARAALAPVAFNPHGGSEAERAAAIIEKLDSGGAEAALKTWNGEAEEPAA